MITTTANKTQTFKASGKLMLFGEYLVLSGAKSLSFPLKYGQVLEVTPANDGVIRWESYTVEGEKWFWAELDSDLNIIDCSNSEPAEMVQKLLSYIRNDQPELNLMQQFTVRSNFNLAWGLGSSSTFISVLSQWSGSDPFELLATSFGGSGYDIACATSKKPLIYQITGTDERIWEEIDLNTAVTDQLLFVYSGQKQSSAKEIKRFERADITKAVISEMNEIVDKAVMADSIAAFESMVDRSEDLLSPILGREKLKEHIFADYKHSVKSLGAWGGDYFLATFRDLDVARNYFKQKGFDTMFTYNELVK